MGHYPSSVKLEDVSCPNNCTQDDTHVLTGHDRLHGISGEFTVLRCNSCGLERTTPRPTPETMGTYYPDNYAPYQSVPNSVKKPTYFQKIASYCLSLESRTLPNIPHGKMLEIGCSSGNYMEQARKIGWDVEGIEFSNSAAEIARSRGFNVVDGAIEDIEKPHNSYDIIVGWMVLEHLHQPIEVLEKLKKWVKKDGYLIILVPDTNSLAKKMFKNKCYDLHLPAHLFHYSAKSLEKTLNLSGWEVERKFWQRNANTFYWSLQYWAEDNNHPLFLRLSKWLRFGNGALAKYIRNLFAVILGITHQSGRIEVWAKPISNQSGKS